MHMLFECYFLRMRLPWQFDFAANHSTRVRSPWKTCRFWDSKRGQFHDPLWGQSDCGAYPLSDTCRCLSSHANMSLVGGLVAIFYFPRNIGNLIIPIDFHIFQRGSNHQPACRCLSSHASPCRNIVDEGVDGKMMGSFHHPFGALEKRLPFEEFRHNLIEWKIWTNFTNRFMWIRGKRFYNYRNIYFTWDVTNPKALICYWLVVWLPLGLFSH